MIYHDSVETREYQFQKSEEKKNDEFEFIIFYWHFNHTKNYGIETVTIV